MKSLFVMDPLHHINVAGDSTYVIMRECTDRGFPVWTCTPADLFARDGVPGARVTPTRVTA
ncbi:MAG: glutathione synthase, partial [Deltaproteobacteria bacterium]|nr:glutathione synthase [Deltaproteobacteria bacterium]